MWLIVCNYQSLLCDSRIGGNHKEVKENLTNYSTPSNSTSNSSVAFGGIKPPAPRAP